MLYKLYYLLIRYLSIVFLINICGMEEEQIAPRDLPGSKKNIIFNIPQGIYQGDLIGYFNKDKLLELDLKNFEKISSYIDKKDDISSEGIMLIQSIIKKKEENQSFLNALQSNNDGFLRKVNNCVQAVNNAAISLPGCIDKQVDKTMGIQNAIKKSFEVASNLLSKVSNFFDKNIPLDKKIAILIGAVSIFCLFKLCIYYFKDPVISDELKQKIDNDFSKFLEKKGFNGLLIDAFKVDCYKLYYRVLTDEWIKNDNGKFYNNMVYLFIGSSVSSIAALFCKEFYFSINYIYKYIILAYKTKKKIYEDHIKAKIRDYNNQIRELEKEIEDIEADISELREKLQQNEKAINNNKIRQGVIVEEIKKINDNHQLEKLSIMGNNKFSAEQKEILKKDNNERCEQQDKPFREEFNRLTIARSMLDKNKLQIDIDINLRTTERIAIKYENTIKIKTLQKQLEKTESKLLSLQDIVALQNNVNNYEHHDSIENNLNKNEKSKIEKLYPFRGGELKIDDNQRWYLFDFFFNTRKMTSVIFFPFFVWAVLRYLKYDESVAKLFTDNAAVLKQHLVNLFYFVADKILRMVLKTKSLLLPLFRPTIIFLLFTIPYFLLVHFSKRYNISHLEEDLMRDKKVMRLSEYVTWQLKKSEQNNKIDQESNINKKNVTSVILPALVINFADLSYDELMHEFYLNYDIILIHNLFPNIQLNPEKNKDVELFELLIKYDELHNKIVIKKDLNDEDKKNKKDVWTALKNSINNELNLSNENHYKLLKDYSFTF
jgi:hypothetical protein